MMRSLRSRLRTPGAIAIGVIATTIVVSIASAHESWLQPGSFFAEKTGRQTVRMTSGMGEHYPTPETAVERSRVVRSGVLLGGKKLPLTVGDTVAGSLNLSWDANTAGVATVWIELAPKVLDLPDSLIGVYFDEIGASPELRKEWTDTPGPKKWRESYAKHSKTYVRIGSRTATQAYTANAGLKLEIVPDRDPTTLRVGDRVGLRVMYEGKALPNFTIAAFHEGANTKPTFVKTDVRGLGMLRLDHVGGILLAGVHLRRVHEPNLEWRSDFTSMTFPVQAK